MSRSPIEKEKIPFQPVTTKVSVYTTDDEEHDLSKYQLNTTADEENDVTEEPIDKEKPSPSAAAPI